jgi:hypothetical protein
MPLGFTETRDDKLLKTAVNYRALYDHKSKSLKKRLNKIKYMTGCSHGSWKRWQVQHISYCHVIKMTKDGGWIGNWIY